MLWIAMISEEQEITAVAPADWGEGSPQGSWTYETYAALPDDGCCYEIVQGVLIISPVPAREHRSVRYQREMVSLSTI